MAEGKRKCGPVQAEGRKGPVQHSGYLHARRYREGTGGTDRQNSGADVCGLVCFPHRPEHEEEFLRTVRDRKRKDSHSRRLRCFGRNGTEFLSEILLQGAGDPADQAGVYARKGTPHCREGLQLFAL